jgi:hypothetical protein
MVVMAFKIAGSRAARQPHVIYHSAHGRQIIRTGYVKSSTFGIGNGTTVQIENVLVIAGDGKASYQGLLSGAFLTAIGGVIDFRDGTLQIAGYGKNAAHR